MQSSLAVFAAAAAKAIRTPAAKKAAVELTAAAASRIRELLQERHKVGMHVYGRGTNSTNDQQGMLQLACSTRVYD